MEDGTCGKVRLHTGDDLAFFDKLRVAYSDLNNNRSAALSAINPLETQHNTVCRDPRADRNKIEENQTRHEALFCIFLFENPLCFILPEA